MRATVASLSVHAAERCLLHVAPLVHDIVPDELVWTLEQVHATEYQWVPSACHGLAPDCHWLVLVCEQAKDGASDARVQLTLTKADEKANWATSLAKDGGVFECWTSELRCSV